VLDGELEVFIIRRWWREAEFDAIDAGIGQIRGDLAVVGGRERAEIRWNLMASPVRSEILRFLRGSGVAYL
jgi:hypothetical protein